MNKGILFITSLLSVLLVATSCNRSHICICDLRSTNSNNFDTTLVRELKGYTPREAKRICDSEEFGTSATTEITCTLR